MGKETPQGRSFFRSAFKGLKNWMSGGWNGRDLPIWAPDHPLNRYAVWASSGIMADKERIENDFEGYVLGALKADGPVFACAVARAWVFGEAEFCFKEQDSDKIDTKNPALALLQQGYEGNAQALLVRIDLDVTAAGNSWWTITNDRGVYGKAALKGPNPRLAHLRPDWVTMIIRSKSGDPRAIDAHLAGILYKPLANGQGYGDGSAEGSTVLLTADEVAQIAPIPDPVARFRGMSWITPVVRHIESDKAAAVHKHGFLTNAAVPNLAIKFSDETSQDDIDEFRENFQKKQAGQWNAGKTLFLMGGADPVPLTHDFKSMDFTNVVGKGEGTIAAAAGVPPSWVNFSEGMQGSALNSGNLAAMRRRFADGTIRPLWRHAVNALSCLVEVPDGSVLWWDETGIAFLREDQTDLANILKIDMGSIDSGIRSGYDPDFVVQAIAARDISILIGHHTGLVSVQMQPPVDPDNKLDETLGEAEILQHQAQTIQTFVTAGFTHESAVKAVEANDLSLLEKDTSIEPWSPTGTALRVPGSGADNGQPQPDPDAPGATPSSTPTGKPTQPQKPAQQSAQTQPKGGNSGK